MNKRAIIMGATSGLGKGVALGLLQEGYIIGVAGRRNEQLDETSVRSIDYRKPTWKTSQRLQELTELLSELKDCLKILQKRNSLSITPKVEDPVDISKMTA